MCVCVCVCVTRLSYCKQILGVRISCTIKQHTLLTQANKRDSLW